MSVGKRIAEARRAVGLSQEALASKAGLTKSAVSQIESGATKSPTPQNLFRIAEALGASAELLVFGKGAPPKLGVREPAPSYLPEDELELLETFRRLPEQLKRDAQGHLRVLHLLSTKAHPAEHLAVKKRQEKNK